MPHRPQRIIRSGRRVAQSVPLFIHCLYSFYRRKEELGTEISQKIYHKGTGHLREIWPSFLGILIQPTQPPQWTRTDRFQKRGRRCRGGYRCCGCCCSHRGRVYDRGQYFSSWAVVNGLAARTAVAATASTTVLSTSRCLPLRRATPSSSSPSASSSTSAALQRPRQTYRDRTLTTKPDKECHCAEPEHEGIIFINQCDSKAHESDRAIHKSSPHQMTNQKYKYVQYVSYRRKLETPA